MALQTCKAGKGSMIGTPGSAAKDVISYLLLRQGRIEKATPDGKKLIKLIEIMKDIVNAYDLIHIILGTFEQ